MGIEDIVNVTITRETTTPTVESFSDILIAGEFLASSITPAFNVRVRQYSSLSELASVGFSTTGEIYLAAQAIFSQNPKVNKVYVGRKLTGGDGTETWTEALNAINAEDSSWYGLIVGTRTQADQELAATWTESNEKLLGLASNDSNIIGGTGDIAEYLQTNNLSRTFCLYNATADGTATDDWADAAWMGERFPSDPGTSTWKFKTLAGVAVDSLSTTERSTVIGKNGNVYTTVAGVAITQDGTTGEGEYIDVIRGVDALKSTIETDIYALLVSQEKVPFTDGGIKSIEGILKGSLQGFVASGFLLSFETSAPLAANVSAVNKGNRLLPDITFTATLAGAVHAVEITGTVSL